MSCNNKDYSSKSGCDKLGKSPFERYPKGSWKDGFVQKCEEQDCLRNAIIAATNFDKRKMHSHQYRIGRRKMQKFGEALLQIEEEMVIQTFDDLYGKISSKRLYGIGELTIYDTATRIGAYLKIYPEKIYLHAGTRIGAEKLLGKDKVKGKKHIEKEFLMENCPKHFQAKFRDLCPADIEDALCMYKNQF